MNGEMQLCLKREISHAKKKRGKDQRISFNSAWPTGEKKEIGKKTQAIYNIRTKPVKQMASWCAF